LPRASVARAQKGNKVLLQETPALAGFCAGDFSALGLAAQRLGRHFEKARGLGEGEGFHTHDEYSRRGQEAARRFLDANG